MLFDLDQFILDCLAAQSRNVFSPLQPLERIESRLNHVVRIGGANRLRQHILHTSRRHHRPYRASRNHARAFRSRLQQHASRPIASKHQMRNRGLGQVDPHQVLLGGLNSLADGLRNFFRLARSVTYDRGAGIAYHHERGE